MTTIEIILAAYLFVAFVATVWRIYWDSWCKRFNIEARKERLWIEEMRMRLETKEAPAREIGESREEAKGEAGESPAGLADLK